MAYKEIEKATYSPEDNKLRLYPAQRLDAELYARVKAAGFRWAPKQELFVAPAWTVCREDLCIELAGSIEAEQTTLVERAEAKAERLDALANKRQNDFNAYAAAAERLLERFADGQPILMGHHSQLSAERGKRKADAATQHAIDAHNSMNYWHYKANGVERHANMKNSNRTRINRIKTLLSELRTYQRRHNFSLKALGWLESLTADAIADKGKIENIVGGYHNDGSIGPYRSSSGDSVYNRLHRDEITPAEAVAECIEYQQQVSTSITRQRAIAHVLNRLGYERSFFGETPRFTGELTPVILQEFARTQGADKPKATATDAGFRLVSPVALPLHVGDGDQLELSADGWRDLMQAIGYEVVQKVRRKTTSKKASIPLINPTVGEAERLQALWNAKAVAANTCDHIPDEQVYSAVLPVTQTVYSANSKGDYSRLEACRVDSNGYLVTKSYASGSVVLSGEPVARVRVGYGNGASNCARRVVLLTDKPGKPLPIKWGE